jgi:hypothetical protein
MTHRRTAVAGVRGKGPVPDFAQVSLDQKLPIDTRKLVFPDSFALIVMPAAPGGAGTKALAELL